MIFRIYNMADKRRNSSKDLNQKPDPASDAKEPQPSSADPKDNESNKERARIYDDWRILAGLVKPRDYDAYEKNIIKYFELPESTSSVLQETIKSIESLSRKVDENYVDDKIAPVKEEMDSF